MSEKLEVKIGPLRLTPLGVEAEGVAKGDGQETVLYICGQEHHLNPGMNWNESALIVGCDERKTREILEHPVTQERMAEARAMLLTERMGALRGFLDRLPLIGAANPTPTTGDQQQKCEVKKVKISPANIYGAAEGVYAEALATADLECGRETLRAKLHLAADMDESGETITDLSISEIKPSASPDFDWDAVHAAITAHPAVQETLAQMRRDLIDVARASTQRELSWLESIE